MILLKYKHKADNNSFELWAAEMIWVLVSVFKKYKHRDIIEKNIQVFLSVHDEVIQIMNCYKSSKFPVVSASKSAVLAHVGKSNWHQLKHTKITPISFLQSQIEFSPIVSLCWFQLWFVAILWM